MKKQKVHMPFSSCFFFHFETNLIKFCFLPGSEAERLPGLFKIFFFLINLVPRIPSFYIRIKFRLKNRVTTVHILQCKRNSFIHLCFLGRNLLQIKEHLEKPPLISKKVFLIPLHLSAFVYNCLHFSSLVCTGLVTWLRFQNRF